MQRGGITVENPYASVNIPRGQLENSFIKRYLGEEQPSPTVIVNPGAVPTYPAPEQLNGASKSVPLDSWDGSKVLTRESWAQPYNPYASLKLLNGASSAPLYTIELDKHQKSPEVGTDSGCCCCECERSVHRRRSLDRKLQCKEGCMGCPAPSSDGSCSACLP